MEVTLLFGGTILCGVILMGMCAGAEAGQPAGVEYLSDSRERIYDSQQSWGVLGFDIASHVSGQAPPPIKIKDKEYAKGIGTHASSEIVIGPDGEYESFEAEAGAQWQEGTEGSVVFHVVVDGKELFKSGVMRRDDPAVPVRIPVKGAMELKLLVDDAGNGIACDGANWAEARLIRDPSARPAGADETRSFEIAPFARVVTCDPRRADGCRTNRLEEFRAEDLFLETEILPASDGSYAVPNHDGLGCIGLQWAERRIPMEIALDFTGPTSHPATSKQRSTRRPGAPDHIVIRLRHPEGKKMVRVTVNGVAHTDFDPAKETVRVRATTEQTVVRTEY